MDHAGVNAVQDSTSQVGLLRPTPRLSDEGKARFFLAVQNGRCWPIASFRGNAANGRFRRYSDRRWRLFRDMIDVPAFSLTVGIFWERQLRRSGPPPSPIDLTQKSTTKAF